MQTVGSNRGLLYESSDDSDTQDRSRLVNNKPRTYQTIQYETVMDHERNLDMLGETIRRQKYMAGELANEVDLHNEILDGIDSGLASTNDNLRKNTRNIRLVTKKSSTAFLWFLIVILGVVIVILALI